MPSPSNSQPETPYTRARDHLAAFRLYSAQHRNLHTLLADLKLLEFALHRMRGLIVQALRAEGATWREVGEALGTTESAARHQYGGLDAPPATRQN